MSSIFKVNTRANWANLNPVLLPGETAVETQTNNVKVGDGVSTVAGDYLELIWATSNAQAYIHSEAAATSPFAHPSIPGVVCTVVQVASA